MPMNHSAGSSGNAVCVASMCLDKVISSWRREVVARHLSAPAHKLFKSSRSVGLRQQGEVVDKDMTMSSDASTSRNLAQHYTRTYAHLHAKARLSAALHHSTLCRDKHSMRADRLCAILARHFKHIRYAPPSESCSHASVSCKSL